MYGLYDDMAHNIDIYDTSNFDRNHPVNECNNKVAGKFQCETGSVVPWEFIGLCSKMYSLLVPSAPKPKLRAKRVKKSYVKQHITHSHLPDFATKTLNARQIPSVSFPKPRPECCECRQSLSDSIQ